MNMATAKSRRMDRLIHDELETSDIAMLAERQKPTGDRLIEDLLQAVREHRQDGCNRWYCFGSIVLSDLMTRDIVDLNIAVRAAIRRILALEGELAQLRQGNKDV